MLTRILEPEVMASAQEALDYDAMDHSSVNGAFVADLLAFAPELARTEGAALDLGAGTALIAIALAKRTQALCITARDMSEAMLEQAHRNIAAAGLEARVYTERADAKHSSPSMYHFVISNSVVHHIAEPVTLLAAALTATNPGGGLFVRDLLRPDSPRALHELIDRHATPAASLFGEALASAIRQRELFAASLHAALTLDEARACAASVGIDAAAVNQTSDRHWTLAHRTAR